MIKLITALSLLLGGVSVFAGSAADDINVMDPWAREVPPVVSTSAAFMMLKNTGSMDHKIVSATFPGAGMVELHTHTNDNGVMRMRQVENIPVAAGGTTTLQPGGLHLMLMMLKAPLKAGDKIAITLELEDGSKKEVQAEVRKHDMEHKQHHMH